jgi:hypothetical protein
VRWVGPDAARLIQTAVIVLGVLATYLAFLHGRLWNLRLEVEIAECEVLNDGSRHLIRARVVVKNLATARVGLTACAMTVGATPRDFPASTAGTVQWVCLTEVPILDLDTEVEGSEVVREEVLISVPLTSAGGDLVGAYRLTAAVSQRARLWHRSLSDWSARSVAIVPGALEGGLNGSEG